MSEPTFNLRILTPFETRLDTQAVCVNAPGAEGRLGILAGHSPLIAGLEAGIVLVNTPEEENRKPWSIDEGVLIATAQGVTILTETAQTPEDLPEEAAAELRNRAASLARALPG